MFHNKIKVIVFMLLIFIFIFIFSYGILGMNLSFQNIDEIKANRIYKKNLINTLKINDIDAIKNIDEDIFYYHLPVKYKSKKYVLNVNLEDYKYKIIDYKTNIITVNYNKEYKLLIYNDKYYDEVKVIFTSLPLINIKADYEITSNDLKSKFTYINSNNREALIDSNIMIHTRGASSRFFDKKSYKIEFYNKDYSKDKNINIENFYNGDSLILNSLYTDPSKIRNVLAFELWNNISKDYTNVDVKYEFVEVFINNKYHGLYVLLEPINRKNLNLYKTGTDNTSVVIKSNNWSVVDYKEDFSKIYSNTYLGYEIKYPNDEEYYDEVWYKFLSKISNYYRKDIKNSYEIIDNTFNINNYIDLILFNSYIENIDNQLMKNNYFYMTDLDSKIYIQPWDMELSFGLYYDDNMPLLSIKKIDSYTIIKQDLYHKYSNEINELIVKRYYELRKTILNEKNIDEIIDNYLNILKEGPSLRDSNKWYNYDINEEIEDVRTWIHNRIKVFDEYIKGLENEL